MQQRCAAVKDESQRERPSTSHESLVLYKM